MLNALQERSQAYQNWLDRVEALLDREHSEKPGQDKIVVITETPDYQDHLYLHHTLTSPSNNLYLRLNHISLFIPKMSVTH